MTAGRGRDSVCDFVVKNIVTELTSIKNENVAAVLTACKFPPNKFTLFNSCLNTLICIKTLTCSSITVLSTQCCMYR